MFLEKFFTAKEIGELREVVKANTGNGLRHFFRQTLFFGLLAALAVSVYSLFSGAIFFTAVMQCFAVFFGLVIVRVFWQHYVFELRKKEKELVVPDALLQAGMFPEKTDIVKVLKYLSAGEYGLLGKEFERTCIEIERGASVRSAFNSMKERNRSSVIGRMCELLVHGHESGAGMQELFREAAEDMLETYALLRERNAAMALEKYTLLFAGGIIVPCVLGLIAGMVQGFDFSAVQELELGMSAGERNELMQAVMLGNQIYIAEYALIASLFVAVQENNRRKAVVYAMFLLPLSFAAYFIAKGM